MSAPVLPPPFDLIGGRRFSFYPALVNVEHNEWVLRRATWSEVLVANTKTSNEIWIPRRFVGEVSRTDEPVMILGLTKELEYKAGQVIPHIRRVLEMPKAVNDSYRASSTETAPPTGAPIVGIRLESSEKHVGRLIVGALAIGIAACVVIIVLFRAESDPRVRYNPVLQTTLGLTAADYYHAVLRKLGAPANDSWRSDKGELRYRLLSYPAQGFTVVLMGTEQEKVLYLGAVDSKWRVVDAVQLPGGKTTGAAMLRALKPREAP